MADVDNNMSWSLKCTGAVPVYDIDSGIDLTPKQTAILLILLTTDRKEFRCSCFGLRIGAKQPVIFCFLWC